MLVPLFHVTYFLLSLIMNKFQKSFLMNKIANLLLVNVGLNQRLNIAQLLSSLIRSEVIITTGVFHTVVISVFLFVSPIIT